MIRKIFITLLVLLVITGCANEETSIEEEEETVPAIFTVEDTAFANTYSELMEIYFINASGDRGLLQLPNEYNYDNLIFQCEDRISYRWMMSVDDSLDLCQYLDNIKSYSESLTDKINEEVFEANTYVQVKLDFEDGHTEYYEAFIYKDLKFSLYLSYSLDTLDLHGYEQLKQMKEIYVLEMMELPDEFKTKQQEIDEEYREVEEMIQKEKNNNSSIDQGENIDTTNNQYPNDIVE